MGNQTALAGWTSGTKLENERINRSMGFTIDVYAGVTFTDGLFTDGMVIKRVKWTPHPPMTSRYRGCTAMREGAVKFDFPTLSDFLEQVDIVRWSNTTATNILRERRGRVARDPALEP